MRLGSRQFAWLIALGLPLGVFAPGEAVARNLSCDGFYLTMTPNERDFVDQRLHDAAPFWSADVAERAATERKLGERLALVYPPARSGTASDPSLERRHWKLMIRTHCDLLNGADSGFSAAEALTRFEWLANIYLDKMQGDSFAPPDQDNQCPPDAPLPRHAVEMMVVWNAYNLALSADGKEQTALYQRAADLAWKLYQEWKAAAYRMQTIVHPVPIPDPFDKIAQCKVLQHGPLNDVAAALWVRWMAMHSTDAGNAANLVRCFPDGLVYDSRLFQRFWRPAETVPDNGRPLVCEDRQSH